MPIVARVGAEKGWRILCELRGTTSGEVGQRGVAGQNVPGPPKARFAGGAVQPPENSRMREFVPPQKNILNWFPWLETLKT